jgi:hypothetical protein
MVRFLTLTVYVVFGALFLVAGSALVLLGTGLLPGTVRGYFEPVVEGDPNVEHILQEYGSLVLVLGVVTLWFARHYDVSRSFHWAMTAFWGLIALIHWFDVRGRGPGVAGPLINTLPFALFLAVGLLRLGSDRPVAPPAGRADKLPGRQD